MDNQELKQQLETLISAVGIAAEGRSGSYAQRNPLRGKMVRCPQCHTRRRQRSEIPCCSAKYQTTAMQVDEDGNETIPMTPKAKGRKNPRLTRKRPPLFLMRQRLLDLEANPELVGPLQDSVEGQVNGKTAKWGHTPQKEVAPQHLAAFVEKVILRDKKLSAKRKKKQQKESRRINRA